MAYELYYWPEIQGRGEFVRLALEQAGADYVDIARKEDDDLPGLMHYMQDGAVPQPPFAPPYLKAGDLLIGQTANILLFLGDRHGLAPADEAGRLWTHQLQLTIADLVAEVHDTHHPIGSGLYYEDQKPEAKRRTADFLAHRVPKYLGYFERVMARNPAGDAHLVGAEVTTVDLSMFQIIAGLRYAFPKAMARIEPKHLRLAALHDRVAALPRVKAYLDSPRRIPFNPMGIFRHYPELDP
ncbi:glutathione S-transferase [Inquilinus sp. OTU3971]|uniref:glutathione S-transferase n=1 Tax=Inquilinus sp. OTU3971 TaxID=3043855 RepID=UPI00313AC2E7